MNIGDRERLVLYWLSDYSPGDLPERAPERDCFLIDETYPLADTDGARQLLVDAGYMTVWRYDSEGNIRQVHNAEVAKLDPTETFFRLTEEGGQEAFVFVELLESDAGRRKSAEFARGFAAEQTRDLPFSVVVPDVVPDNFDPVPDVILFPDGNGVTLRYYEDLDDQLFIDETTDALGEDEVEFETEIVREDRISGVLAAVRERQVTSEWAEISASWQIGAVSFRVSYHRTESAVPDEDLIAELDEAGIVSPYVNTESRPAEIDDAMRLDMRRMVESIIAQT